MNKLILIYGNNIFNRAFKWNKGKVKQYICREFILWKNYW